MKSISFWIVVALTIIGSIAYLVASDACSERGGVLVRGAFGLECVEPRR